MYKNIEKQKVLHMAEQVDYQDGQIVSRTLVQNSKLSMTLFAFEKDEEISTHAAGGDAMVTVLEGTGSPWAARSFWCLRARRSSCPRISPMRCTGRSGSRCC